MFYFILNQKAYPLTLCLILFIYLVSFISIKVKINNSKRCLKVFMVDVHSYMDSLQFIDSKDTIVFAKELNLVEKGSNI